MDSLKYKSKVGYVPPPMPQEHVREVYPNNMPSFTAPFMPLNGHVAVENTQVNPAYPVLEPPKEFAHPMPQPDFEQAQVQPSITKKDIKKNIKNSKKSE